MDDGTGVTPKYNYYFLYRGLYSLTVFDDWSDSSRVVFLSLFLFSLDSELTNNLQVRALLHP